MRLQDVPKRIIARRFGSLSLSSHFGCLLKSVLVALVGALMLLSVESEVAEHTIDLVLAADPSILGKLAVIPNKLTRSH